MINYILLGIIQGLTEFFPVSSSAHLVIFQKLLGIGGNQLALFVVLHLGTVLALLVFFFNDILVALRNIKTIALIILVTAITGAIGLSGKDFFERLFSLPKAAALALAVTGVILFFTKRFLSGKRITVSVSDALVLGLAQGFAVVPGISRSGMTISTLLFRGIDVKAAFRFSFLASIPAVLGAAILEVKDISLALKTEWLNFSLGFAASFIAGIIALKILKVILEKAKLHWFGYYCIITAVATLIFIK